MSDSGTRSRRYPSTSDSAAPQIALPLVTKKTARTTAEVPEGREHVVAGLFAGIGGLERGLHRSGHRTTLLCENDPAAMAVLAARFPGVPVHDDVAHLRAFPRKRH